MARPVDLDSVPKRRHTKDEKIVVEMVREDYTSAKNARQNSCYWDVGTPDEVYDTGGAGGGDWLKHWDILEKADLQWFDKPSADDYSSNVKSPMITGRIDSTIHKLRKVDLAFQVYPSESSDPKDKRKAKIVQELINRLFRKGDFRYKLITWFRDALVYGNAFLQIYYEQKQRDVKLIPKTSKQLTEEQKKTLKETGERQYVKKTAYEYDDVAIDPCKLSEIYVDPSARCLHGESYEAQYIVRRMLPSYEQFMATYKGDEDAKNIDKVRPGSVYKDTETQEFFKPPEDIMDPDYVEVLHYYNKAQDRYVVIANDIVIKDMPLPYNHKELPFVHIVPIEKPHQFYGIGLADRLIALQSEEEYLKNLVYDRLHITANPVIKVKRTIYGEFSRAYQTAEPGTMVPVNNQDDVMPMEYPSMSFDMFRALDMISRDATIATQIDPTQMGLMQRYVSATTTMATKEQLDMFINSVVDAFSEQLGIAGYQIYGLIKQFYTKKKVDESRGGKGGVYKKVRLENIEVNPETFEITKKKGEGEYTFLEIKPEYFEIQGDLDIFINPESMQVVSQAIEMQKSQANLAQLAPFMVDPTDSQKAAQHPQPWVDGPKVLEWYSETNKIPKEVLLSVEEDEDIAVKRAEEQGKLLLANKPVAGIPGESEAHKAVHVAQLREQNRVVEDLARQIDGMGYGPYAIEYVQNLPIGQALDEAKEVSRNIANHLSTDDSPKILAEEAAVEQTAETQQGPQVPMPPGLTPAGSAQPPMPGGGNQMGGLTPSPVGEVSPPMGMGGEEQGGLI